MNSKHKFTLFLTLLTDYTNSEIILTKNGANTILKSRISKRDNNNIFEELGKDNLERECIEQSCSSEEMMEIWKNAPGKQEIVGGGQKYHALRTELKRIRKVQNSKKTLGRTVEIQNNLEGDCRNDDECATYFQVLNDPCSVEVDTFLLDPEFSISGWNISAGVDVNEVCWGPGTVICKNKYSERTCECKPGFNVKNFCKSDLQLGFVGEICPREVFSDLCDNDALMIGVLVGGLVLMVLICVLCMWNCGFFDCCCSDEEHLDDFDAPESMFRGDDRGYSKGIDV